MVNPSGPVVSFGRRHRWASVTLAVDLIVNTATTPWPAVQLGAHWTAVLVAGYLLLDLGWQHAKKTLLRWIRRIGIVVILVPRPDDD
ncbi:hypothetical protein [Nocardia lijiangensis]|uniref:hypothetical protein n=1 Tax=Nocardia lijiangensis TaxID=299618 RepID=UPI000ABFDFE8|nr:hypothetical protein [Nocardia lijiangensis]